MANDFSGFPAVRPAGLTGFGAGFRYTFFSNTADADPGNGMLRLGSSPQSNSTRMTIDNVDASGSDIWSYFFNFFTSQIATNKGLVILTHLTDPSKWSVFRVTAMNSGLTGYFNLTVANVSWSGVPFADYDPILVQFDAGVDQLNTSDIITSATNDSAASGRLGQYVEARIESASAVTLANNTAKTVTSLSVAGGDWDVDGCVSYVCVGSPTVTALAGMVSLSPDTIDDGLYESFWRGSVALASPGNLVAPARRVSAASNTTVYLIAYSLFSGGTSTKAFGIIRARRVR